MEKFGKCIYLCKGMTNEVIYKRHVDQIIKTESFFEEVGIKSSLEKKEIFNDSDLNKKRL